MAYEFFLPELGEGIKSGTVIALSFNPGETVSKDDPILEIETDKAAMGLPAPVSGKLVKYTVAEGQDIKVGDLIAIFDEAENGASSVSVAAENSVQKTEVVPEVAEAVKPSPSTMPAPTASSSVMEFNLPELGEGIKGGAVISVYVKDGSSVAEGDPIIELETDKAAMSVPSPVSGVIKSIKVQDGQEVVIGQLIAVIEASSATQSNEETAPVQATKESATKEVEDKSPKKEETEKFILEQPFQSEIVLPIVHKKNTLVRAGPATRKFARELGVDLTLVEGTKRNGRIDVQDVKNYVKRSMQNKPTSQGGVSPQVQALPDFSKWGNVRKEPLSKIRKIISERMVNNWNTIPHVYQFQDIDITSITELQKRFGNDFKEQGSNASPTNFFIKAMVNCMQAYPQFNSSLDVASGELIYKEYYNIGVAVDTPAGLLVPVLRGVDKMSIFDIGKSLREIAGKARDRKITPDQMMGASMTLSNLGGIGGTHFTPIVPWPEVAILGVARSQMKPVWNGKEFQPRNIVTICLSYDHRVIDGADAARYVVKFKDLIENYEKTLMGAL